jgi:hypothetical protein
MERHINPFDSFDNCNTRSSPPGKVFWEIVKENDYFVLQVHKAENKPQIVGDLMKGLKRFFFLFMNINNILVYGLIPIHIELC